MLEIGEWFTFSGELSSVDGDLLRYPERAFNFPHCGFVLINQSTNAVGTVIWDAEVLLAHYLDDLSVSQQISNKLFLEIGAGTSLAAIVAAKGGARVFIQELDEIIPECKLRIEQNHVMAEFVGGLWGNELSTRILSLSQSYFDFIVMADVLYHPEHFSDLNTTILNCSKIGTEVVIAFEVRRRDLESYFQTFSEKFETLKIICYDIVRQENDDDGDDGVDKSWGEGSQQQHKSITKITKFYLYHLKRIS